LRVQPHFGNVAPPQDTFLGAFGSRVWDSCWPSFGAGGGDELFPVPFNLLACIWGFATG